MKEKKMKRLLLVGILFIVAALTLVNISLAQPMKENMGEAQYYSEAATQLKLAMRKLWEDHIVYTRNYIISALAGLEDSGAVAQRLLKNQDDIGSAIKPYYGEEAGNKLAGLLRDHIMIATEVVQAAKEGNNDNLSKANVKWHGNADAIAAFLNGANPNWSKNDLTDMLYKHLEYTTGEVTSRIKKDWAADIGFYDKGHMHMLMFADILVDGIVKQFPAGMHQGKMGMMKESERR